MVTTTTEIGRAKLVHPDYNYDAGTGLHTALRNMYTDVSDNLSARWLSVVALPDTSSQSVVHDFGMALGDLEVLIFESDVLLSKRDRDASYTITQTSVNEISIQNVSGGAKTFKVLVLAYSLEQAVGRKKSSVSTGDATPTTLLSWPVATGDRVVVEARVVAKGASAYNAHIVRGVAKNNAGTVTFTQLANEVDEGDSNWSIALVGSGAAIAVRVTGFAATAIDWHGTLEVSLF